MKLAILNDETTETWLGGAALVNEKIKSEIESRGHECVIWTYNKDNKEEDLPSQEEVDKIDHFLFANFGYWPPKFIDNIMETKQFSTFRHDLPIILYTQPPSIMYKEFYDAFGKMFQRAKISFFISPMQQKVFQNYFLVSRSEVLPPPLDLDGFENLNEPDREGSLYVGDISPGRGCEKALALMKQHDKIGPWVFVGQHVNNELVNYLIESGATVMNPIPHEEMPVLMNAHKRLFYYPDIYDSFCLKILEAELCGMQVAADTYRIGRYSYEQNSEQLKEMIQEGAKLVVDKILEYNE